ncbi:MAG TPA: nucleoside/nucleotide kinase family protein [Actinocrinis sp.]|uniref:nucleoside/nucleotide kinase family protein n=1 Tax=Actinocrinis sp. TaxID=1920516 RepID=UPI002DDD30EB|nr:nucleoside/nucleotide kinase family protein [Actinocrinis sp.]HEV3173444.1 nucleoside/nucleotide kinase family protein [Actinocrinis sp.]
MTAAPEAETVTVASLAERIREMAAASPRTIIGIAGPPGAGKSTVAEALVDALGPAAALVPMDGFHLSNRVLESLGRRDRKGAPDTFDAAGYIALLRRLRTPDADIVYAPAFRRDIEEPIGSSIPVPPTTPIVITEGNYLLLDTHPWRQIRGLIDAAWYLQIDDAVRVERLVARHVAFDKTPQAARAWAQGSDQRNADIVAATARRADLVLRL